MARRTRRISSRAISSLNKKLSALTRSVRAGVKRRRRRRSSSGSRRTLLQLGRWKLTTASLLGLAAIGGIGYWLYNNKKTKGTWL